MLDAGSHLALLGAVALLAGIQRSTVSLVVIVLEGTGNTSLLIPIIVTTVVANVQRQAAICNSVGFSRVVETVSGFGRSKVFFNDTNRVSLLNSSKFQNRTGNVPQLQRTTKRKSILWFWG